MQFSLSELVSSKMHFALITELLAKTLERRARQAEEKDTLLTQLSERAAVVLREKEQAEAAVKAAAGEADAAAAKLQALQFRLQEAEVRCCSKV